MNDLDYGMIDHRKKSARVEYLVKQTLNRASRMFVFDNVPDGFPLDLHRVMWLIMTHGEGFWVRRPSDGSLHFLVGEFAGVPDELGEPTMFTFSNVALNWSGTIPVTEGVRAKCDSAAVGLLPMIRDRCSLIVENRLTMRMALINARTTLAIVAGTTRAKEGVEKYLQKIADGDPWYLASEPVFNSTSGLPSKDGAIGQLTDCIEMEQYLVGSQAHEIGIRSTFNFKRESLSADETNVDDDFIFSLPYDMLKCAEAWVKDFNDRFGYDIRVRFDSPWLEKVPDGKPVDEESDPDDVIQSEAVPDNDTEEGDEDRESR